jgi:phosphocarrier protein
MVKGDGWRGDGSDASVRKTVTIVNRRGLHARAAARFVKVAAKFDAEVSVAKNGAVVSGLSIMGLMMLAAGSGSDIEIQATGAEAKRAIAALGRLIANKFHEE